jgi:hypothetical protein
MDLVTNHFLKCFVSSQMRHKGTLNSADLEAKKQANQMASKGAMQHSGGDYSSMVLNTMREIAKTNKFLHKNDVWTTL